MSHPELVFPVSEEREALELLVYEPDGMLHAERYSAAAVVPCETRRRYTVDPALEAWAHRA